MEICSSGRIKTGPIYACRDVYKRQEEEVEQAINTGAYDITLGKRILRTETAGMALMSVLMFETEE